MTGGSYQSEPEALGCSGLLGFGRVVDFDVGNIKRSQTTLESLVIQNLVAVLFQGLNIAGQYVNIHILRIPGTSEKEAQIDAAFEDVKAWIGLFQKPVEKIEVKNFAYLGIR